MIDPTKPINKLVTYFCLYAVTHKTILNMGRVNNVDPAVSSKNAFLQVKENAKLAAKQNHR